MVHKMREYKCGAVSFDMDGTLLDTMGIWDSAPLALLAEHGIACTEQIASTFHGLGFEVAAEHLSRTYLPQYSPEALMEQIVQRITDAYRSEVEPKPGATALLQELARQGIPVAVVTSNRRPLAEAAFRRLGWQDFSRVLITAREFGGSKQSPEIFRYAASQLGAEPAQCLVFEDSLPPAQAAVSIGMSVVAILDAADRQHWQQLSALAVDAERDFTQLQLVLRPQ